MEDYLECRARAACLAIAARRCADSFLARASPPLRPRATAAAFLPLSVSVSSISPVAIFITWTAFDATSAGRLWPFGVFGTSLPLSIARRGEEPNPHAPICIPGLGSIPDQLSQEDIVGRSHENPDDTVVGTDVSIDDRRDIHDRTVDTATVLCGGLAPFRTAVRKRAGRLSTWRRRADQGAVVACRRRDAIRSAGRPRTRLGRHWEPSLASRAHEYQWGAYFEHLLDAAPCVVELLDASAHLKVLATSRAVLHV